MNTNLIKTEVYNKPKNAGGSTSTIVYNIGNNINTGDINAKVLQVNRLIAEYVRTNALDAGIANLTVVNSNDGTINSLAGNTLNYQNGVITDLTSENISVQNINDCKKADINKIFNQYLQTEEINTDYLTVNKAAYFHELVIDKMRSVDGTFINTAASCKIDYVEPIISGGNVVEYRCYFRANDNSGNEIENNWLTNDQAISMSNNLTVGENHNVANHYYWRLVLDTSRERGELFWVNFDNGDIQQDDGLHTPDYKVWFLDNFTYATNKVIDGQPLVISDWNHSEQITGTVRDITESGQDYVVLTVKNLSYNNITYSGTMYGVNVMPAPIDSGQVDDEGNIIYEEPYTGNGVFSFSTKEDDELNITVFYDNDAITYYPYTDVTKVYDSVNDVYNYSITVDNTPELTITNISITSNKIYNYHLCHWISLSNISGQYDTAHFTDATKYDMTPAKGDDVVQLGYRYNLVQNGNVDRASAIIIAAYQTPDEDIQPPSYAQYQGINKFSLEDFRGTYMDASGCYVKGKLVTETGTEIDITDQGLNVDNMYYSIICRENPITKPATGSKPITINVLKVSNGVGELVSANDITGFRMTVNGTQITGPTGQPAAFTYTISSSEQATSADIKLYGSDNAVKDNVVMSIIDFGSVTDGTNGSYDQFIYKYSTSQPATPTSSGSNIPTGWSTSPVFPLVIEGYKVWVSTRHVVGTQGGYDYSNPWSTPVLFNGENGQDGQDGTVDKLIPFREMFEVQANGSTTSYESIVSNLYTNLEYQVYHVSGDTVSRVTNLTDYTIEAQVKALLNGTGYRLPKTYGMQGKLNGSPTGIGFVKTDNKTLRLYNVTRQGTNDGEVRNILDDIYSGSDQDYRDYNKLSHMNNANYLLPIEMIVRLKLNNNIVDERHLSVIYKAGSIFAVTESALNSVFFGSWQGSTGIVNSVSSIHQDMQGIQTQVTTISNDYVNHSELSQTATAISASVYQTIDGDLQETGIDIENGKITLQAGDVIFTDGQGATNTNISIDPTTGTLHATNGDFINGSFSGVVHANQGYFGATGNTFNMSLNADDTTFKLIGAKEIKCHKEGGETIIDYPYVQYSSSTIKNFEYVNISPGQWTSALFEPGSDYGRIALNPTIIMKTPIVEHDTVNDYYVRLKLSPNEIVFTNVTNNTETNTAIVSPGALVLNANMVSFGSVFVDLNNYANNTAAIAGGLVKGDVYHTNGTLKIVY